VQQQPLRRLPDIVWFGLFVAGYYFAYRYGLAFSQKAAAPLWFPTPVLLCALICIPRRWWPLALAATLPIRLWTAVPPATPTWFLLATAAVDYTTALLAALLLRWLSPNPLRFETLRKFALYCLVAVFLAPALGSTAGALTRLALGSNYWVSWQEWFWGNALANLIVTPFIFYWVLRPGDLKEITGLRLVEAALLVTGLIVSLWMAFEPYGANSSFVVTRVYVPIAFLIWAGARFGVQGASGAIILFAIFAVRAALSGFGPFSANSPLAIATQMQHFLLFQAAPLYLVGVMSDASRRSEQSLRESERRFRSIADTAPVLIWVIDQNRRCRFVNKGWLNFTGRTLEQELGFGWREGVHPDDLDHVDPARGAFDLRQPFELEYRLRRHDGEYRWIMTRGVPRYGTDGEFLGYIGSAIDVTERKRIEEADRKLNHAARLATLGELTAVVSHEINQPLFSILSNAEAADALLQRDKPPVEELRRILADIHKDDLRASEVIRVVRTLTHRRTPQMAAVNLNELVSNVVRLMKADAARRRIEIRQQLGVNLPAVLGDESSLEQVILNLMMNGMDAMRDTPKEARQLTVSTTELEYGDLQIAVIDRGHGIAADKMSQLFESFFTTKPDGMGLGLSTSRQIVESHNGRIYAVNNPTGGATFYVTLPSINATRARDVESEPTRSGEPGVSLAKSRALDAEKAERI